MPKTFTSESEKYIKKLILGPGLSFEYTCRLKSYEENLTYRKKHNLDVYNSDGVLLGFAKRFTDMWQCCLLINYNVDDHINDMAIINKLARENNLDIPELTTTIYYGTRIYYSWTSKKTGFCIRKKINQEIRDVAAKIKSLNHQPKMIAPVEMQRI